MGAGYDSTQRGPGMFIVNGIPSAGKTVAELEQALRREIAEIVAEGVTDEELKRVKAQVVSSQVFQRDSIYYQAMIIGSLEIAGYPHSAMDRMIDKLREVTPAQVQEVAKKYLVDDSLTIAVLDPQPLDGAKPRRRPECAMRNKLNRWWCALILWLYRRTGVGAVADPALADEAGRARVLRRGAQPADVRCERRFSGGLGVRHAREIGRRRHDAGNAEARRGRPVGRRDCAPHGRQRRAISAAASTATAPA